MKHVVLLAMATSLVIGGVMMFIAWDHNPQCEFHCEGQVYWGRWILVGASWALPGFLLITMLASVVHVVRKKSLKP